MKAVAAQFEQVKVLKRHQNWLNGPSTTFSFATPGRQSREVTVYGATELRSTMPVVAVLRDPDDWGSLIVRPEQLACRPTLLTALGEAGRDRRRS
jgi:hypothetical protein